MRATSVRFLCVLALYDVLALFPLRLAWPSNRRAVESGVPAAIWTVLEWAQRGAEKLKSNVPNEFLEIRPKHLVEGKLPGPSQVDRLRQAFLVSLFMPGISSAASLRGLPRPESTDSTFYLRFVLDRAPGPRGQISMRVVSGDTEPAGGALAVKREVRR
jgi:hypothetical protein